MSETTSATEAPAEEFIYHGRKLLPMPPRSGITLAEAKKRYHIGTETLRKRIVAGLVKAGYADLTLSSGQGGRRKKRCVLVSSRSLAKLLNANNSWLTKPVEPVEVPDPVSVGDLAEELHINRNTIRVWCGWETHPGLGRKIRSTTERVVVERSNGRPHPLRALRVSREDVTACAEAMKEPTQRRLPGNPGVWESTEGVFRHDDGRTFYTAAYVVKHKHRFGFSNGDVLTPTNRGRLEILRLVWPLSYNPDPWLVTAISKASLDLLLEFRSGKADGGRWLADGIWGDAAGMWYTAEYIAKQPGGPKRKEVWNWVRDGRLAAPKKVPSAGWQKGRLVAVFHSGEINPLIGIGGAVDRAGTTGAKGKRGRKPSAKTAELHEFCWQLRQQGKKLSQVMHAANQKWPGAIKDVANVATYAKRHSDRQGK